MESISRGGGVVQPMEPRKLKAFMTHPQMTRQKIEAVVKAVIKYNKICTKAAEHLNWELDKIIKKPATIAKPVPSKKKVVTKKPISKK